jgi:hypothetical protein
MMHRYRTELSLKNSDRTELPPFPRQTPSLPFYLDTANIDYFDCGTGGLNN